MGLSDYRTTRKHPPFILRRLAGMIVWRECEDCFAMVSLGRCGAVGQEHVAKLRVCSVFPLA